MKDLIVPVNNEAHSRALISVVGEETAQVVLRAYTAIDSAMVFGFDRGAKETLKNFKELSNEESFNAGQLEGHRMGFQQALKDFEDLEENAWNRGYGAAIADQKASGDTYEHGVDQGFSEAWDDGFEQATKDVVAAQHKAYVNGRDGGWMRGYQEAEAECRQAAYDDGYIDGVSDARVSPSDADARVAELCNPYEEDDEDYYSDDAFDAFDGTYDESTDAAYDEDDYWELKDTF